MLYFLAEHFRDTIAEYFNYDLLKVVENKLLKYFHRPGPNSK